MHTGSFARTFCALGLFAASACGSSSKPIESPTTAPTAQKPSSIEAPSSSASKQPRGLNAPDNDPSLVALAREALACFREPNCEAQTKWNEPLRTGRQVDFKTLVHLLEDEHPEIRSLAASILRGKKGQPGFHTDTKYATRVLDALDREEDEHIAREIAMAAAFIEVTTTGLEERMVKIMRMDLRERVRVAITESILINNWDVPTLTAAVKGMTSDASNDVRVAAIRAFDVRELQGEACEFWASMLTDRDSFVVNKCFYYLAANSCKAQNEEMLSVAERRPPSNPEIFQPLCQQVEPKDPFTKRFIDALEKWATTTTLSGTQRSQSLNLLATCDLARAKKVSATLLKDQDEGVRQKATDIDKIRIKP